MPTATVLYGAPLQMEDAEDGVNDRLLRAVGIDVGKLLEFDHVYDGFSISPTTGNTVVEIEEGFLTDWSSVPALAQSRILLGPKRRYRKSGLGHDKAYRVGVPRKPADEMWWIISRSGKQHVTRYRGAIGWFGLRLGGWRAYRKRRLEREG